MATPEVLRFRAVPGVLVAVPGNSGGRCQYVGRRTDHDAIAKGETDLESIHPTDAKINAEYTKAFGHTILAELARICRHGDLEPADDITAKYCGVKPSGAPAPAPVRSTSTKSEEPHK